MSLFEVEPDQTNVTIKLKPLSGNYVQLEYVRKIYKYAIFRATNWRNFWRIWHGNKRTLKKHKLEVVKNDGRYEIYLPIGWYHHQLTEKALDQLGIRKKRERYNDV